MREEDENHQVEQTLTSLRSLLISADDVVMHGETALVTHRTHLLSARRTVPLSLRNGLLMTSSIITNPQFHTSQMERQWTPVAADEISSLSTHVTAIIPFIGRLLLVIVGIVIRRRRRLFFRRLIGGFRRWLIRGFIFAETLDATGVSLRRLSRFALRDTFLARW